MYIICSLTCGVYSFRHTHVYWYVYICMYIYIGIQKRTGDMLSALKVIRIHAMYKYACMYREVMQDLKIPSQAWSKRMAYC